MLALCEVLLCVCACGGDWSLVFVIVAGFFDYVLYLLPVWLNWCDVVTLAFLCNAVLER